jgi:hypothetical protein
MAALLDLENRALCFLADSGIKLPGLTAWAVLRKDVSSE